MEEIFYSGQLKLDELAAALRMGSLVKKWQITAYWLFVVIYTAALVGAVFSNLFMVSSLIPFMIFLILGVSVYFAPAAGAHKAFADDSEFKNPLSGVISPEGLSVQSSKSLTQLQWTIYKSARLSPGYVLLYQTSNCFNVFRRTFFANEADWKAFRSLVEQKVAKKTYYKKDPTAPLFSQYASLRNINWLTYGILLLIIVFILANNFLNSSP